MDESSMSSGQKRATIACTFCRQRKRRCNGDTPQCRTCRIRGLECVYQEQTQPKQTEQDESDTQLQRLEVIETLLREHSSAIEALKQTSTVTAPTSAAGSDPYFLDTHTSRTPPLRFRNQPAPLPLFSWPSSHSTGRSQHTDNDDIPPLTIPLGHQTSASTLLALSQMRCLAGDFPKEFFFRIEDSRQRSNAVQFMSALPGEPDPEWHLVDKSLADGYLEQFFSLVHTFHPFFNHDDLVLRYEEAMKRGLSLDDESALFLAIFALGATASEPIDCTKSSWSGDIFIRRALQILLPSWTVNFGGDLLLSQALVLCALYFTYVVEPLAAWRFVYMASTNIQQLLIRYKDIPSDDVRMEHITRISWACFVIESDILAEFHQPRSGIELLVDRMPFPNYGTSPTTENLSSLADISARTLLNRIHHTIYFTDSLSVYIGRALDSLSEAPSPNPDSSLLRVCEELTSQLDTWYDSLPDAIKPDLSGDTKGNSQISLLRSRYWSIKLNIYRPFVIYVTSHAPEQDINVPQSVIEKCQLCLSACRMFILTAHHQLLERTPYTYSTTMCCFSSILVLSIASQSPQIQDLVDDIEMLLELTVELLRPWALPGSSIECALEIVNTIFRKKRFQNQQR
ncbi:hypothetical protein F5884DRAFT_249989 [Xylogone sp. PMI_703]|nr:hypothetical protein F5884DRAFT_249989 [Xylogone sp. PMI_703]